MKRIVNTLVINLIGSISSYGQLFFTPGYVVTQTGDTLRGELRERDNTTLLFRRTTESSERRYAPEQLTMYRTDNGIGRSATWSENGRMRWVFMREVSAGYISLLELIKPEERLSHAIRLPDQTDTPLRGNLALLLLTQQLGNCKSPSFGRLLSPRSFYNERAYFERVVRAYNDCVRPEEPVIRQKKTFHYEAGLLVGIARNTWLYGANQKRLSPYWDPNGVYSPTYAGVVGGFLTMVPRKRLSLTIESQFSYYSGNRTVSINNPLNLTDPATRQYSFKERYVAFPVTGRYVFATRPVRWYVTGGMNLSYALSVGGQYSGGSIRNATIPIRASFGMGYVAGVGAEVLMDKTHRLHIELRTAPHLVMDKVTRMANSRSLQFTVGVPLITR